jgi:hypothetical protein
MALALPRGLVKQGAVPLPAAVAYLIPIHIADPLIAFTIGHVNRVAPA